MQFKVDYHQVLDNRNIIVIFNLVTHRIYLQAETLEFSPLSVNILVLIVLSPSESNQSNPVSIGSFFDAKSFLVIFKAVD